jgi:predicted ribosome quality control (RQC) complex YloA/Tae2 family protein
MSLSSTEIGLVVAELSDKLVGGAVRRVRSVADDPGAIVLECRSHAEEFLLFISATSARSRLHFVQASSPQSEKPDDFVMLLRKHLEGARLTQLRAEAGDRVVLAEFAAGPYVRTLVAELTDRHANMFLLDELSRILGSRFPNKSEVRPLLPGNPWVPPERAEAEASRRRNAPAQRAGWPQNIALVHEFLEHEYSRIVAWQRFAERKLFAESRIKQAVRRVRKKITAIDGDIEKGQQGLIAQKFGELLLHHQPRPERGVGFLVVTDWNAEEPEKITLELDPKLDWRGNVDKFFSAAKKAKRGLPISQERRALAQDELDALYAGLTAVGAAESPEEVEVIERRLTEARVLPRGKTVVSADAERDRKRATKTSAANKKGNAGKDAPSKFPYREFKSSDGYRILVGKNSKDNDTLTFRVASGNDLWLHTADWSGSHVIIRIPKGAGCAAANA